MTTPEVKPSRLIHGWNRYARDLDRALSVAGFSDAQHLLIKRAVEASWGPATRANGGEAIPFRINLAATAKVSGYARETLSRQHQQLVECRVFLDQGDGSHRINKDYREWTRPGGSPRLSADQVAWCLQVARAEAGRDESVTRPKNRQVRTVTNPSRAVKVGGPDRDESVTHPYNPEVRSVTDRSRCCDESVTHPYNRTVTNPSHTPTTQPSAQVLAGEPEAAKTPHPPLRTPLDEAPAHPGGRARVGLEPETLKTPPTPRGGAVADDEVATLACWADALPGHEMESLGLWARSMVASYPAAWVREALLDAVSVKGPAPLASYANGCLRQRRKRVGGQPGDGPAKLLERERAMEATTVAAAGPAPAREAHRATEPPKRPRMAPGREAARG